jgi:hypothetical protein
MDLERSTPPTEFGDPQALVKLRCDALLAAADVALYPFLRGLAVTTRLPETNPATPILTVRSGPWVQYQYPVMATNVVRCVAWARNEDDAWSIASWFHGQLLSLRGDDESRGFALEEQPNKSTDPQFGVPIVPFAVRARMKPRVLPG